MTQTQITLNATSATLPPMPSKRRLYRMSYKDALNAMSQHLALLRDASLGAVYTRFDRLTNAKWRYEEVRVSHPLKPKETLH